MVTQTMQKEWNLLFSHLVFIVSSEHPLVMSVVVSTSAKTSPAFPLLLCYPFFINSLDPPFLRHFSYWVSPGTNQKAERMLRWAN